MNIDCSCCINTYKRPELLKKLLISLTNQVLLENIIYEIIVIENDLIELSKNIVEEVSKSSNITIKYFLQPEKNIAITRNKAVAEAKGRFLIFVDDDEYADEKLIYTLVFNLKNYNADAVFGKVIPYFNPDTPKWIINTRFFEKHCSNLGEEPKLLYTSNCIIKAEVLKKVEGPFDPKYGITGGSDSMLFSKLWIAGAKYISCPDAIVYDYIPPERANSKWMIKRMIRTGNSFARRTIELAKYKILIRLFLFIKAMLLVFFNLMLYIINIFSKDSRLKYYIKSYSYIGHILAAFNYHYEEYK